MSFSGVDFLLFCFLIWLFVPHATLLRPLHTRFEIHVCAHYVHDSTYICLFFVVRVTNNKRSFRTVRAYRKSNPAAPHISQFLIRDDAPRESTSLAKLQLLIPSRDEPVLPTGFTRKQKQRGGVEAQGDFPISFRTHER